MDLPWPCVSSETPGASRVVRLPDLGGLGLGTSKASKGQTAAHSATNIAKEKMSCSLIILSIFKEQKSMLRSKAYTTGNWCPIVWQEGHLTWVTIDLGVTTNGEVKWIVLGWWSWDPSTYFGILSDDPINQNIGRCSKINSQSIYHITSIMEVLWALCVCKSIMSAPKQYFISSWGMQNQYCLWLNESCCVL